MFRNYPDINPYYMRLKTSIALVLCAGILLNCGSNEAGKQRSVTELVFSDSTGARVSADLSFTPPEFEAFDEQGNAVGSNMQDLEKSPGQASRHDNSHKKMLIHNGSMGIKTSRIMDARRRTDSLLTKLNGYYESENLDNNNARISFDLIIRVPAENFTKLVAALEKGPDEITSKNISTQDVTTEFIDEETRLASQQAYHKKYLELLARAANIKDILEIQEKIRSIQEEIDSREQRLKYLNDQVNYSTLTLSLYHDKEYVYHGEKVPFLEKLKSSLAAGWDSIVYGVLWCIGKWPFALLILLGLWFWRRRRKNKFA